ncbi:glycosyltransferase family 87 protein [Rhabdothermincola sediminis]|uniref:glycosyltransferase family 87 protein n=1 Tax=Rhabdothermincola sediminis TaxID=2751370 RepID=UPI001AA094FB|nr:glycosyltransferase family 87 protein [Rhabdothermincola sediminis]
MGPPLGRPSPALVRNTRALLAALGIAFAVALLTGSGSTTASGRLGGDYPSFYAAGKLLLEDPSRLYDPQAQAREQQGLFGDERDGGQLYFAYPPYDALPYAALAQLPYRLSYAVHTAAMVAAAVAALWLVRPMAPLVDRYFEQTVLAALVFYPLFKGVTGGQNTALVLLAVAAFARGMWDGRELLAGLAAGGLLLKPQYAVVLVVVLVVTRRWRSLGVVAAAGVLAYLAGAELAGWGWVGEWLDQVSWLAEADAPANGHNAISFLGVAESLWGFGAPVAQVVGWGLAAVAACLVAGWWWRAPRSAVPALMAVTAPVVLLVAPHAIYYDGGLLVLALAILAAGFATSTRTRWAVAVVYGISLLQPWSNSLRVAPVFVVTVGVLGWAAARWTAERRAARVPGPGAAGAAGAHPPIT